MDIREGELKHPQVIELLRAHHQDMLNHSPPESVHALDLSALDKPNISFWCLWSENSLAGIGALKALDVNHGEIKSMRTSAKFLRQGVAAKVLTHLINEAKQRNMTRISLETGTMAAFEPAQKLYKQFGFKPCPPFGDYKEDPYSMFMTLAI